MLKYYLGELEKAIKWFAGIVLLLIVVLASLVAPIDFTPLPAQPFYQRMMEGLDSLVIQTHQPTAGVKVGWSQFSIVPDYPMPLAGYKPREPFTGVHDSVYMRILAIDNGAITAYLVTADLLLFPPALKQRIQEKLGNQSDGFIYYSATHTHTSVGGWDPSLLGSILMGAYDDAYIERLAEQTITHLNLAKQSLKPGVLSYWEKDIKNYVSNRLDRFAAVDSKFRGFTCIREDSSSANFMVLGAHPTSISKNFKLISADYPGAMIHYLSNDYDFVEFMPGTIGSQRFRGLSQIHDYELVDAIGKLLTNFISDAIEEEMPSMLIIKTSSLPIQYGPSQLRVTDNLKLRDWVFRLLSGPLEGDISILQIGNVLMLGTSTDFSGELLISNQLESFAAAHGMHLIITSFNGAYTGYITDDLHYKTSDDEEVRILNWVGPYFGQYYVEIIKQIIVKSSQ